MRAVCVIGLGLIGGSVLRAAATAGRPVWGATASEADAAEARAEGFDVVDAESALRRAAEADALVVVATPLTAVREVLRQIAEHAPDALLTDVVSVKDPVDAEVRSLLPSARYAGGHPMAGVSSSGWSAGSGELFAGAAWAVIVEENTTLEAWREAAQLALDCGAQVVPTSASAHDSAVARVSHLPHLFAAVLAAVGADGGPLSLSLAAGSFRDGTRVAGTAPELVRAMTEGNRGRAAGRGRRRARPARRGARVARFYRRTKVHSGLWSRGAASVRRPREQRARERDGAAQRHRAGTTAGARRARWTRPRAFGGDRQRGAAGDVTRVDLNGKSTRRFP